MNKTRQIELLLALVIVLIAIPDATAKKKKEKKEPQAVAVTLYLNNQATDRPRTDGNTVKGYLRSAMVNDPTFFEVSETPDGERVRYISEEIDSLSVMDRFRYVKRTCKNTGFLSKTPKTRWVRIEYEGNGIDLYSAFFITQERVNNTTIIHRTKGYYFSIDQDIAILASSEYASGPYDTAMPAVSRKQTAHYFDTYYDYPQLAERIQTKEFDHLISIAKTWENAYGGQPVRRASGKIKANQQGVQKSVAATNSAKSAAWKKMKSEVVFPKHIRTLQAGVSPTVAGWSQEIKHNGTGYHTDIPPITLYMDVCFLDFSRLGSIGYTFGATYSKYGYQWQWDDGYGPKTQETTCNRFDVCAGVSWHWTLCRNFEAYTRIMLDLGVIGNRTIERETGEKQIGSSEMDTHVRVIATGGLRYYFSKRVGLYAEGGYDIGYVTAGLSFRF